MHGNKEDFEIVKQIVELLAPLGEDLQRKIYDTVGVFLGLSEDKYERES